MPRHQFSVRTLLWVDAWLVKMENDCVGPPTIALEFRLMWGFGYDAIEFSGLARITQ